VHTVTETQDEMDLLRRPTDGRTVSRTSSSTSSTTETDSGAPSCLVQFLLCCLHSDSARLFTYSCGKAISVYDLLCLYYLKPKWWSQSSCYQPWKGPPCFLI